MLDIIDELKNIYRNDMFPIVESVTPKDLVIYFPALELTIETDQIVDDSFELSESLCSEQDLVFGACEASKVKFTLADVEQDLKGQWFTIEQVIDGFDPVPLGKYKVDSCVKQDNLRFKDITAYDALKSTDVNVADWYNNLFTTGEEVYTLTQFRAKLLNHLGIEYESETLPNDNMIVEKTIEPTQISGREVLRRCVELNGAFGHIGRTGKFRHIILQPAYGLYPTETLYPAEDLYPVAEGDTSFVHASIIDDTVSRYRSVRFEEYTVKEIDKLQIRAEEYDIGAIVGTGSNTYVIQGNFLVFGKSASELELIARNAYGNMAKRPYRPYEADSIGLPYVEVGDTLEFATDDTVVGYVLQRTLTGIQALQDKYAAEGNEEREQNFGVNEEIIQLQGKVTRIKKDVEGVSVEVEDLAQNTASKFEQTSQQITAEVNRATAAEEELSGRIEIEAERITTEVTRATEAEGVLSGRIDVQADRITAEVNRATTAEGVLSGQIDVLAGQIVLKVDSNGNVAAVKLDADAEAGTSITLTADNIKLEGLVTANGNFKILEDGSMEAVNGKFTGDITGGKIEGVNFTSSEWDGNTYGSWFDEVNISGGQIRAGRTFYDMSGRTYEYATIIKHNSITTRYAYLHSLGSSSNYTNYAYITDAYIENLYVDNKKLDPSNLRARSIYAPTGSSNPPTITLDTAKQFVPSDMAFSLGTNSTPWANFHVRNISHKTSGTLGFFGKTPISQKKVTKLSAGATLDDVINKVNGILDALGDVSGYGLLDL